MDIKLEPTKEETKVMAKALVQEGYSSLQIEEWLGISDNTVLRASREATPDELKRFEEDFQKRIKEMKQTGIALVQKRLLELIPKERRMDQLVKAGEYLEGKNNQTLIQNNMTLEIQKDDTKT